MVVTDDDGVANDIRQLKGQGVDPNRRYWFPIVGYNYRMTNIQAAIGLAQLEKADWHIERRREIALWYYERLREIPGLILPVEKEWAKNAYWMFSIVLDDAVSLSRDQVMVALQQQGIETRPFFHPMHTLPPYEELSKGNHFPVAEKLAARGLNLPTWAGLKKEDIDYICNAIARVVSSERAR